jgi:hypothetical protein
MVVLRPVKALNNSLPLSNISAPASTTALGDWYAKRVVVDRKPLVVLVSSKSLLAIVISARDLRSLPDRLPELVASRLRRHDVDRRLIEREVAAMSPVVIAPTADRSVIGIMIQIANELPAHLEIGAWDESTLPIVEAQIAQTPWHAGRRQDEVIWPDRAIHDLLLKRWG